MKITSYCIELELYAYNDSIFEINASFHVKQRTKGRA